MHVVRGAALACAVACFASAAGAQAPPPLPNNTLLCDGFSKAPDGAWHAGPMTQPFDLGAVKEKTVRNTEIVQGSVIIGDVDLYDVLERKCGRRR